MGKKLPPLELALYRRCDEVLHYIWDPIGVAGAPGARDEYESYLPQVFKLVLEGAEPQRIIKYLVQIETEGMCLEPNVANAASIVEVLLEWREWLLDDQS
jgi:hypothetical protein